MGKALWPAVVGVPTLPILHTLQVCSIGGSAALVVPLSSAARLPTVLQALHSQGSSGLPPTIPLFQAVQHNGKIALQPVTYSASAAAAMHSLSQQPGGAAAAPYAVQYKPNMISLNAPPSTTNTAAGASRQLPSPRGAPRLASSSSPAPAPSGSSKSKSALRRTHSGSVSKGSAGGGASRAPRQTPAAAAANHLGSAGAPSGPHQAALASDGSNDMAMEGVSSDEDVALIAAARHAAAFRLEDDASGNSSDSSALDVNPLLTSQPMGSMGLPAAAAAAPVRSLTPQANWPGEVSNKMRSVSLLHGVGAAPERPKAPPAAATPISPRPLVQVRPHVPSKAAPFASALSAAAAAAATPDAFTPVERPRKSGRAFAPNRTLYNDDSIIMPVTQAGRTTVEALRFYPTMRDLKLRIGSDGYYDQCIICGQGGMLMQCDGAGCHHALHVKCIGLPRVPRGNWFCKVCVQAKNVQTKNKARA